MGKKSMFNSRKTSPKYLIRQFKTIWGKCSLDFFYLQSDRYRMHSKSLFTLLFPPSFGNLAKPTEIKELQCENLTVINYKAPLNYWKHIQDKNNKTEMVFGLLCQEFISYFKVNNPIPSISSQYALNGDEEHLAACLV